MISEDKCEVMGKKRHFTDGREKKAYMWLMDLNSLAQ